MIVLLRQRTRRQRALGAPGLFLAHYRNLRSGNGVGRAAVAAARLTWAMVTF